MKETFVLKEEQFLVIEEWQNKFSGVTAGFTTKNGGIGKDSYESLNTGFHVGDDADIVKGNRAIIAKALGFPLDKWVGAEQTHETKIIKAVNEDMGKGAADYGSSFKGTDGIYTKQRDLLITLCFADCVPLFFISPKHGYIGAAHAGWKGTVGEIARKMINKWESEGISPDEIYAAIGPSICKECYIVDDKVIKMVQNLLEEYDEKPYNTISKGQYQLDLRRLNAMLIQKSGVPASQILTTQLCTSCDSDLFFSHRRDHGRTGRLMSFIGWKED
ncbi:peptidoglycan editing factor PgeF [Peribacillus sp. SCS-155]|uniref:peptidoglycan editing factor PgeF n=1 Tax=Peribacillus sedimenti TaxID=3115297 RepID=UPI003906B525